MQKITLIRNTKQTNKNIDNKNQSPIHLEQIFRHTKTRTRGQQQEQQNEFSSKINQKRVAHFVLPDYSFGIGFSLSDTHANENERKIEILIEIYLSRFSTVSAFVVFCMRPQLIRFINLLVVVSLKFILKCFPCFHVIG